MNYIPIIIVLICVLYVIFIIDKEQGCGDGKCYQRSENKCITELRNKCDKCEKDDVCVYGEHCGDTSECIPKQFIT
jgi:hypothetical protein